MKEKGASNKIEKKFTSEEDFIASKFKDAERLGVKKEDFENIEGFKNLSKGQQALLIDNFLKYSFTVVEESALSKMEEEKSKAGLLGKVSRSIFQKGYYEHYKAQAVKEISQKDKDELFTNSIREMAKKLSSEESGIDADIDITRGEIKIRYTGWLNEKALSAEENKILQDFNEKASQLQKIPLEWEYSKSLKNKFEIAKQEYNKALAKLAELEEKKTDKKTAIERIADINKKVNFQRFFETSADVEKELSNITSQHLWIRIIKSVAFERGSYFGFGMASRALATGALGIIGAPAAAAAMGGFMGRKRAIEELKRESLLARGGKEQKVKTKVSSIRKVKLANLRKQLKKEKDPQKIKALKEEIDLRSQKTNNLIYLSTLEKNPEKLQKIRNELDARFAQKATKENLLNFVDAEKLSSKLERLITELEMELDMMELDMNDLLDNSDNKDSDKIKKLQNNKDSDKIKKLRTELSNRLLYTQTKIESGLVRYGSEERIIAQYDLLELMSRAQVLVGFQTDKDVRTETLERLDSFLAFKEKKISKYVRNRMIKGALYGAAFATAGYLFRDLYHHINIGEEIKNAFGLGDKNPNLIPAATIVTHPTPPSPINAENIITKSVEIKSQISSPIQKGEGIWSAAKELVSKHSITEKQFSEAWESSHSVVKLADGKLHHISEIGLVHQGDEVVYVPPKGTIPAHFEIIPKSHQPIGTDADLYHVYESKGIKIPEFLKNYQEIVKIEEEKPQIVKIIEETKPVTSAKMTESTHQIFGNRPPMFKQGEGINLQPDRNTLTEGFPSHGQPLFKGEPMFKQGEGINLQLNNEEVLKNISPTIPTHHQVESTITNISKPNPTIENPPTTTNIPPSTSPLGNLNPAGLAHHATAHIPPANPPVEKINPQDVAKEIFPKMPVDKSQGSIPYEGVYHGIASNEAAHHAAQTVPESTARKINPKDVASEIFPKMPVDKSQGSIPYEGVYHGIASNEAAHHAAQTVPESTAGKINPKDVASEIFPKMPIDKSQGSIPYEGVYHGMASNEVAHHAAQAAPEPINNLHPNESIIPIHSKEIAGNVEFHYDASGNPISMTENVNLMNSTGHEYLTPDYMDKLIQLSHQKSQFLLEDVSRDIEMSDRQLVSYIKIYEELAKDPSRKKEASFILEQAKNIIKSIKDRYGQSIINEKDLPSYLR